MVSVSTTHVAAPPERVLALLRRAESYPEWVIGTRRLIDVEEGWPAPGTAFVHEVGVGPVRLRDRTRMVSDSDGRVVLDARAQPFGRARVEIRVLATTAGSTVELQEQPVSGVARLIPRVVLEPVTSFRNARSLERFRRIAESPAVG